MSVEAASAVMIIMITIIMILIMMIVVLLIMMIIVVLIRMMINNSINDNDNNTFGEGRDALTMLIVRVLEVRLSLSRKIRPKATESGFLP